MSSPSSSSPSETAAAAATLSLSSVESLTGSTAGSSTLLSTTASASSASTASLDPVSSRSTTSSVTSMPSQMQQAPDLGGAGASNNNVVAIAVVVIVGFIVVVTLVTFGVLYRRRGPRDMDDGDDMELDRRRRRNNSSFPADEKKEKPAAMMETEPPKMMERIADMKNTTAPQMVPQSTVTMLPDAMGNNINARLRSFSEVLPPRDFYSDNGWSSAIAPPVPAVPSVFGGTGLDHETLAAHQAAFQQHRRPRGKSMDNAMAVSLFAPPGSISTSMPRASIVSLGYNNLINLPPQSPFVDQNNYNQPLSMLPSAPVTQPSLRRRNSNSSIRSARSFAAVGGGGGGALRSATILGGGAGMISYSAHPDLQHPPEIELISAYKDSDLAERAFELQRLQMERQMHMSMFMGVGVGGIGGASVGAGSGVGPGFGGGGGGFGPGAWAGGGIGGGMAAAVGGNNLPGLTATSVSSVRTVGVKPARGFGDLNEELPGDGTDDLKSFTFCLVTHNIVFAKHGTHTSKNPFTYIHEGDATCWDVIAEPVSRNSAAGLPSLTAVSTLTSSGTLTLADIAPSGIAIGDTGEGWLSLADQIDAIIAWKDAALALLLSANFSRSANILKPHPLRALVATGERRDPWLTFVYSLSACLSAIVSSTITRTEITSLTNVITAILRSTHPIPTRIAYEPRSVNEVALSRNDPVNLIHAFNRTASPGETEFAFGVNRRTGQVGFIRVAHLDPTRIRTAVEPAPLVQQFSLLATSSLTDGEAMRSSSSSSSASSSTAANVNVASPTTSAKRASLNVAPIVNVTDTSPTQVLSPRPPLSMHNHLHHLDIIDRASNSSASKRNSVTSSSAGSKRSNQGDEDAGMMHRREVRASNLLLELLDKSASSDAGSDAASGSGTGNVGAAFGEGALPEKRGSAGSSLLSF